ncbi:MAG: hypothetical protein ACD_79C00251G0007 [uncultured bacterium]|nr:MAG: hypothetical protein ACD_79C00251G0007 [uncultured bacterium]
MIKRNRVRIFLIICLVFNLSFLFSQSSIEYHTRDIKINPKDSDAYFSRGFARLVQGLCDDAILDFTQAILISPNEALTYFFRGRCKFMKTYYLDALNDFTKAIALNKNYLAAYFFRAKCKFKMNEFNKALEDIDKTLELSQENADLYAWKAYVLNSLKDYSAAEKLYLKAIDLDKTCHFAYNNLAWIYTACENKQLINIPKAISLSKEAVKLQKKDTYVDTLACAYAENQDFKNAMKYAAELCHLNPSEINIKKLELFKSKKSYLQWVEEKAKIEQEKELKKHQAIEKQKTIWQEITSKNKNPKSNNK